MSAFSSPARRLVAATVFLAGLASPLATPLFAGCSGVKVFYASGSGSSTSEAKKNAMNNVKKKVAAYKKKHPGCKVQIKF